MPLQAQAERINKLFLLMMSATIPGEVAAARDALVGVLKREGLDIHDFAKVLLAGIEPQEPKVVWEPPSFEKKSHNDIAAWCLFQIERGLYRPLNERELEFLQDMLSQWKEPTEKQSSWFSSIHRRITNVFRNRQAHEHV